MGYDKIRQVQWLVEKIQDACMKSWVLWKFLTMDEMMVRYKGTYCPARYYMPRKPQKLGIKIWCLVDFVSKFVYNFDIYCSQNLENGQGALET